MRASDKKEMIEALDKSAKSWMIQNVQNGGLLLEFLRELFSSLPVDEEKNKGNPVLTSQLERDALVRAETERCAKILQSMADEVLPEHRPFYTMAISKILEGK